jgi:hypothetical protein
LHESILHQKEGTREKRAESGEQGLRILDLGFEIEDWGLKIGDLRLRIEDWGLRIGDWG